MLIINLHDAWAHICCCCCFAVHTKLVHIEFQCHQELPHIANFGEIQNQPNPIESSQRQKRETCNHNGSDCLPTLKNLDDHLHANEANNLSSCSKYFECTKRINIIRNWLLEKHLMIVNIFGLLNSVHTMLFGFVSFTVCHVLFDVIALQLN